MKTLNSILDEINDNLPAGIVARSALFGQRVVIQYHVRYTQEGKKYSVGVFLTADAAITAMINHKINKLIVVNASHRERLEQLYLEMANYQQPNKDMGLEDKGHQVIDELTNKDNSAKKKMMEAFMLSKPPHEISSDRDYDFLWAADFGGDGRMYTVKGRMISEYYREIENAARQAPTEGTTQHRHNSQQNDDSSCDDNSNEVTGEQ